MQPNKETTKVRVCLDAKSKYRNVSLNDALLKGKLEMPDIMQIITRFRVGKVAMIGDIQKMFWQIRLHPDDQQYHGVIWKGKSFVFTRVSFGGKPSPPIADESMIKIAHEGKTDYPLAADAILDNRYMDDIAKGSDNPETMEHMKNELDLLLGDFGFKIKRWISNTTKNVKDTAILGCKWDLERDTISPSLPEIEFKGFCKRNVLSRIAEIWDPLGFCTGVMISARLIFQSIG